MFHVKHRWDCRLEHRQKMPEPKIRAIIADDFMADAARDPSTQDDKGGGSAARDDGVTHAGTQEGKAAFLMALVPKRKGPTILRPFEVRYADAPYSPSAFFKAETRRRDTGIFSSTAFSVSSSVPPDTDSISSTIERFTR